MSDSEGRIVLVNQEIERLFGYPREELLGKPVEVLIPLRFREGHSDFRALFLSAPRVRAMGAGRELYGQRKDGSEVPIEIGLTPVATDEGLFVLSSVVDIRARKKAEGLLRVAVESSPAGMVMVDAGGQILLVNKEIERMFGYAREELLGRPIEMLVPLRSQASHPGARAGFVRDPKTRPMGMGRDLHGVHRDGTEVPVEIGLNPIDTDDGLVVLASVVDISARRREEQELRKLEDQLRQTQRVETIGALAGGVAHDFNNVLAAIVGYAELLREDLASSQAGDDLSELLRAAERGKQLVERILSFTRRQDPIRRPIRLDQAVAEATRLLRATLPASIEIQAQVKADTPRVLADVTALHQILMNLGTNAWHAMPNGGTLSIAVEPAYIRDSQLRAMPELREGPHVLVTTRDTGTGMTPSVKERAFEAFFTTKPAGVGTGLGLSMVQTIVKKHDGCVQIESEEGRGTSIRCYFPAIVDEVEETTAAKRSAVEGGGERVLYVDDEPSLVRVGQRRLGSLGYAVTGITSSVEALDVFRARPNDFDIVITDYSMPRLDGLELASAIAAIRPDIPILLVSGYVEALAEERVRSLRLRVFRKPLTLSELSEAVREALRRPR